MVTMTPATIALRILFYPSDSQGASSQLAGLAPSSAYGANVKALDFIQHGGAVREPPRGRLGVWVVVGRFTPILTFPHRRGKE